jgi:hypothetical protein
MQSTVGKTYVDDRLEWIDNTAPERRQTEKSKVVRHSELPEGTRIIGPDTMVTMEYKADRWNLHVDENNKITKVRQG